MLAALRGCVEAQWCFELNVNDSMMFSMHVFNLHKSRPQLKCKKFNKSQNAEVEKLANRYEWNVINDAHEAKDFNVHWSFGSSKETFPSCVSLYFAINAALLLLCSGLLYLTGELAPPTSNTHTKHRIEMDSFKFPWHSFKKCTTCR